MLLSGTTWFLSLYFLSSKTTSGQSAGSPEMRLYEQLSANYSRIIRPVIDTNTQLVVNMTLFYYQLLDLDEKREVLESVVWIEQEWYDGFFRWDPEDHDNVDILVVPSDVIWVPDLYVLNLVGDADNTVSPFLGSMETLIIKHTGKVIRVSPFRLITACSMSLEKFPFDSQTCHFTLGSWAYDTRRVHCRVAKPPKIFPNHASADWVLTSLTGSEDVYPYGDPVTNYSLVVFTLEMHRQPLYHISHLVIPSLMLNVIVSFSFFLPPEAGERVSLGLTSFLAYSVFIMVMADKVPESTTSMPLISVFFLINMTLTMVTILWSVISIRIHYRASVYGPPPPWLLNVARLIESSWCSSLTQRRDAYPHVYADETNPMVSHSHSQSSTMQTQAGLSKTTSGDPLRKAKGSRSCGRPVSQQNDSELDHALSELPCTEREESEEAWRLIMCAADRSLFCVFTLVSFVGLVLVVIAKTM